MIFDIVLKQLGRHKVRTSLTVLGVAVGILLVTALSSFSEGISQTVNTELSYLSGIVTVTAKDISFQTFTMSELDESLLDEIAGLSGVDEVAPVIIGQLPNVGNVFGINLDDVDILNIDVDVAEGRFPEEGADEMILGYTYAETTGLKVGDEISTRGKKLEIVGILGYTSASEDSGVMMPLVIAQDVLAMKDKISIILVKPVSAGDAEALAREIDSLYDVQALSEKDAAREAGEFTGQLSIMTFAIGSIAAIIAGIGIMNVMFMSVRERRKEIGTMKALGATTREILSEVVLEAIIITLIGEAIGLVLSLGAVQVLNTLTTEMSAVITPSLLISVTLFALFLGVFSGLFPAREAARLQPAVVLRYE